MSWPKKLEFKIISKKKGQCVKNLILYITVYARQKNNYSLGPFLSDLSGNVVLTTEEIQRALAKDRVAFPMDYADDLENCANKVLVQIESDSDLQDRVNRLREFYPEEAKRLRDLMKDAINREIKSFRREYEIGKMPITIDLEVNG